MAAFSASIGIWEALKKIPWFTRLQIAVDSVHKYMGALRDGEAAVERVFQRTVELVTVVGR